METIYSSETWIDLYRTTRRYNPQDRTVLSPCCKSLKSNFFFRTLSPRTDNLTVTNLRNTLYIARFAILGTHQSGNILIRSIMNIITIHHPVVVGGGGGWKEVEQESHLTAD
jgi:hypothetical protein